MLPQVDKNVVDGVWKQKNSAFDIGKEYSGRAIQQTCHSLYLTAVFVPPPQFEEKESGTVWHITSQL